MYTVETTKICTKCKVDKPEGSFAFKNRFKNIRHGWCVICQQLYKHEHYLKNREQYITNAASNNSKTRKESKQKIFEYLKSHSCIDCGEADIVVLEFDHVRGIKFKEISKLVHNSSSWNKILIEIEKCDVRCCNCHRRKTTIQRNWIKE